MTYGRPRPRSTGPPRFHLSDASGFHRHYFAWPRRFLLLCMGAGIGTTIGSRGPAFSVSGGANRARRIALATSITVERSPSVSATASPMSSATCGRSSEAPSRARASCAIHRSKAWINSSGKLGSAVGNAEYIKAKAGTPNALATASRTSSVGATSPCSSLGHGPAINAEELGQAVLGHPL